MGEWHRDNPELIGTSSDPWMRVPWYRRMHQGLDDVDLNRLRDMGPDDDELEEDER